MKDLLARWAKFEPNRCAGQMLRWSGGLLVLTHDDFPLDTHDHAVVLAAVKEAIEARGIEWQWHENSTLARLPSGTSQERRFYNGIVEVRRPSGWYEEYLCDSPAEALLSAYLSALEAASSAEADLPGLDPEATGC